jgi:hypothetical protein
MTDKKHYCQVSGKEISAERIAALIMLGVPEQQWTCVEHSMTKPKQGIFMGEHGTSDLLLVNKVYDDSVRGVFKSSDKVESDESSSDSAESEPAKPSFYSDKEINYYSTGNEADGDEVNPPSKNISNPV